MMAIRLTFLQQRLPKAQHGVNFMPFITLYYSFLATRHVEWQTDNFAASLIVTKGSTKLELQYFSENTFEICNRYRISFSIKWIPRALLADVDTMSRKIDFDDWD